MMWLQGAEESQHAERGQGGSMETVGFWGSARPTPTCPHDCRLSQGGGGGVKQFQHVYL